MSEETPKAFDATELDDAGLRTEYDRIKARGAELSARETLTDEETSELTELASRVDVVSTELAARETKAAELAATREKFSSLPDLAPAKTDEHFPVVEPATVQKSTEAVAVPSVSELANKQTPTMPAKAINKEFSVLVSSDAAGMVGKSFGEEFDSMDQVSDAVRKSFQAYGRAGGGKNARHSLAQFQRNRGAELTVEREADSQAVLQFARDEKRLAGGSVAANWRKSVESGDSLTAAAGWCAPSENLYDLCRLWSQDGLIDLPTMTVRRGGVNYTADPTYAALDAATSFTFLTEAQVIADTPKNCTEIPCPTFTNRRLDVAATCITGSFLQASGYPEVISTWVDGLQTTHAHKINETVIGQMVTQAGAASVIVAPDYDSATSSLLSAVELAAEDIRYQNRMSFNSTIEIVLPHWVIPQLRADLTHRNGNAGPGPWATDADLARLFAVRNVRVQFVYDWQDGYSGLATGPGGDQVAPYILALPTTVSFLAYPAGSVVLARQDVVTLTSVYDAASLTQNLYTQLFMEEGFATIFPCTGLRLYTAGVCPGGSTGGQTVLACA